MRLLLDTHTLLWLLSGAPELSAGARRVIFDAGNEKLLSIVSLWEITIKIGTGKLHLYEPLADFLTSLEIHGVIRLLPIQTVHLLRLEPLPLHHRDPFDRLIVAQALSEDCILVSSDIQLDAYGVRRIW